MRGIAFVWQFGEVILAIALAPLFSGWIAQCRAWMQNRTAPPLTQPYRMLRKLFHKDVALAENASWLFRTAPYVVFGTMVLVAAIIPSVVTDLPFARAADAIALIGLFATAQSVSGSRGDGHRNRVWNTGSTPRDDDRISC